MIDGLKLTMRGDAVRDRVAEKIARLERAAESRREDLKMEPKDQTDDHPWLPEHIVENVIEELEERIAALTLIRDHLVPDEIYLLDQADLQFAELLPPPPEPQWPVCMGRR